MVTTVGVIRPTRYTGSALEREDGSVFTFDADFNEAPSYQGELTKHPVERGVKIADHFKRDPATLAMTAYVTNSPLDLSTLERDRDIKALNLLVEIWEAGEPITIVGRLQVYQDYVLTSVSTSMTSDSGQALAFDLAFEQVRIVEATMVEIPADTRADRYKGNGKSKTEFGGRPGEGAGELGDAVEGGSDNAAANKAEEQGGSTLHDLLYG